jgi:hypothetical protein
MTPAPADAAVDFYYRGLCREGVTSCTFGGYYASYYKQSGYYQNIRAVLGWSDGSNHKIWISAHRFTGPYGSEVSGWGFVCHSYAANSDTRYALLVNRHSVAQNPMRGRIHLENPPSRRVSPWQIRASWDEGSRSSAQHRLRRCRTRSPARWPRHTVSDAILLSRVKSPRRNGRGWVVPGDRHICIVVPDRVDGFATSCTPLDWALRTGVMIELRDADGSGSMTMLAPDGKGVVMSEAGEGTTKLDAKAGLVSRSVARDEKVVLRD